MKKENIITVLIFIGLLLSGGLFIFCVVQASNSIGDIPIGTATKCEDNDGDMMLGVTCYTQKVTMSEEYKVKEEKHIKRAFGSAILFMIFVWLLIKEL